MHRMLNGGRPGAQPNCTLTAPPGTGPNTQTRAHTHTQLDDELNLGMDIFTDNLTPMAVWNQLVR